MPCDTFVALPPATESGCVVFGKNSDRPASEVQEVAYFSAKKHENGAKVKCTYIEIAEVASTYAVMLSKPCWMWGAEMGANEMGVCIGNEAVWTRDLEEESGLEKRLLGMDLVRLALERGASAEAAVDVITSLLETHGQGGPCSICPTRPDLAYHNSFIVADAREAWVLETAGKHWAAQRVTEGVRNISNELSIGTEISRMSRGLKEHAREKGWWDGQEPFSFKDAMESPGSASDRYCNGLSLLKEKSKGNKFTLVNMMEILRDEQSGICMTGPGSVSTGSQVSVLYDAPRPAQHWFTATPNPACSVYKPFLFVPGVCGSQLTVSSEGGLTTALHEAHARIKPLPGDHVNEQVLGQLRSMEESCVREIGEFVKNSDASALEEAKELFKDSVETEIKFYRF